MTAFLDRNMLNEANKSVMSISIQEWQLLLIVVHIKMYKGTNPKRIKIPMETVMELLCFRD